MQSEGAQIESTTAEHSSEEIWRFMLQRKLIDWITDGTTSLSKSLVMLGDKGNFIHAILIASNVAEVIVEEYPLLQRLNK